MADQSQRLSFIELLTRLRAHHLTLRNRRDTTAIDVPSAAWLCHACEIVSAKRILELGSGFSSWALRTWQIDHPEVEIWTVDDELPWLEKTQRELESLGVRTDHCIPFATLCELTTITNIEFDVVFVDLDNMETRVRHAADFVRWTRPNGLMILDDWHTMPYREHMTSALAMHGITIAEIPESIDRHGRFLAMGHRPVSSLPSPEISA